MAQPQIFDFKFPMTDDNRVLVEDFLNIFDDPQLTKIFTNEHTIPRKIKVDWAMARGVAYATGSGNYQRTLIEFKSCLNLNNESNEFERAMRQILVQAKGEFKVFMLKIRQSIDVITHALSSQHDWSTRLWQAVYYEENALNMPTRIRNGRSV